ncbi:MAG: cytochrome c-type biogenesis protein CcmH [Rickettsiales bacterium]|nr:cytochrome c-type biogenesis protein CcmH [Rickettsiales bacterium]
MRIRHFLLAISLLLPLTSYALVPEPRIPDEAKEQRAMHLFLEVRCLVCEGQVIESSNTEFSFEMRKLIRRKILEGKSDDEIRTELVREFGEDILTGASGSGGLLLWFLPIVFAAGIGAVVFRSVRK